MLMISFYNKWGTASLFHGKFVLHFERPHTQIPGSFHIFQNVDHAVFWVENVENWMGPRAYLSDASFTTGLTPLCCKPCGCETLHPTARPWTDFPFRQDPQIRKGLLEQGHDEEIWVTADDGIAVSRVGAIKRVHQPLNQLHLSFSL